MTQRATPALSVVIPAPGRVSTWVSPLLRHEPNRGKGYAVRRGCRRSCDRGCCPDYLRSAIQRSKRRFTRGVRRVRVYWPATALMASAWVG